MRARKVSYDQSEFVFVAWCRRLVLSFRRVNGRGQDVVQDYATWLEFFTPLSRGN
jgi:hypothetical protein